MRALYSGGLRGRGAMVQSNVNRVYIMVATLPSHVNQGLDMVRMGMLTLTI